MRKFFCASLFLMFAATTVAQTFSFQMCFEDAVGNKDTITLGYDLMGTDSIDSIFGEVNIISLPFDSTLDVRVSNKSRNNNIRLFHTKKQIINYNCDYFSFINGIDIATRHWPVTATWDNTLFFDSCSKGTFFTSINPGGWWDTRSPSDLFVVPMTDSNSVTFSSNYSNDFPSYSYLNGSDTISFFWLAYAVEFQEKSGQNK